MCSHSWTLSISELSWAAVPAPSSSCLITVSSTSQEDSHPQEGEKEEQLATSVLEDSQKSVDNFQERRALAITAKAREIEKVQGSSYSGLHGDRGMFFDVRI